MDTLPKYRKKNSIKIKIRTTIQNNDSLWNALNNTTEKKHQKIKQKASIFRLFYKIPKKFNFMKLNFLHKFLKHDFVKNA